MFTHSIQFFHQLPAEVILSMEILCGGVLMLFMLRLLGGVGLYAFSLIGILASNILVLKTTQFSFYPWPVALGTGIFSLILVTNDIINEYYGRKAALKGMLMGFLGYLSFTFIMMIGIGFKPTAQSETIQTYLQVIFIPAPMILISSLTAYIISQSTDVFLFRFIRWATKSKFLWIRTLGSTLISSFIDNMVFSFLAWYYLADHPKSFAEIWHTYVLGFYGLRVILSAVLTPLIYLAKSCIPKGHDKTIS